MCRRARNHLATRRQHALNGQTQKGCLIVCPNQFLLCNFQWFFPKAFDEQIIWVCFAQNGLNWLQEGLTGLIRCVALLIAYRGSSLGRFGNNFFRPKFWAPLWWLIGRICLCDTPLFWQKCVCVFLVYVLQLAVLFSSDRVPCCCFVCTCPVL